MNGSVVFFIHYSVSVNKNAVVVRGNSPVLAVVIFLGVVLLVIGEEIVKLKALLEVLSGFEAADILEELEVAESVDASTNKTVPVNALKLNVSVIFLEREVQGLSKVNVWALDGVHVLTCHLKLVEVKILREHLHFNI